MLKIKNATTVGSSNKNTKLNKKIDCVVSKAFASTKKTIEITNSFLKKPFILMMLKGKLETRVLHGALSTYFRALLLQAPVAVP